MRIPSALLLRCMFFLSVFIFATLAEFPTPARANAAGLPSMQQQPATDAQTDVSRQVSPEAKRMLVAAKTVLVRGGRARVAQTGQNTLMVYPTKKAEEALKKALVKWGRFQVVDDAAKADLILVISEGEVAESRMERLTGHLAIFPGGSTADTDVKPLWEVEEVGPAFGFNRRPTNKLIEHLRGDLAEFEKPAPPAATR